MYRIAVLLGLLSLGLPGPAQPQTGCTELPPALQVVQWIGNQTWNWTLARKGTTNVYDAEAVSNQTGQRSNHTFELRSFDGKTVVFNRADAGTYTGTVSADGRVISGKTSFARTADEGWRGTFGWAVLCPSPGARPSGAAAREAYETGVTLRFKGDNKAAVAPLERAVKADPKFADSWRQLGLARHGLQRYKEALSDFDRAIELDPRSPHALNARAGTRRVMGDNANAIADATRAIELDPSYGNAYSARGGARYQAKEYALAAADFDQSLKLDPAMFVNIYNRGLARAAAGDNAGAYADFSRFTELEPNNSFAKPAREQAAKIGAANPQVASAAPPAAPPASQPVPEAAAPPIAGKPAALAAASSGGVLKIPAAMFDKTKWSGDSVWQSLPPGMPPDPGPGPRASIPELLDINHLTPAQYSATITAAKTAMRLLMGPVSPEDDKRFETKWAPLYEYPCQPVIEYFNKLNPMLNRFLAARSALHESIYRFGTTWEEATTAAGLGDEEGVREAMQVCRVLRDNVAATNAQLNDIGRQIQALGEPPDPLAHKARARALHKEAMAAAPQRPQVSSAKGPGTYWVLSNLEVRQKPIASGGNNRYTFSASEGFAAGSLAMSEADPVSKKVFKESKAGSVKWSRLERVIPESSGGGLWIPYTAEVQCTQHEMSPNPHDPLIGFPCAFFNYEDDFGRSGYQANTDKPPLKFDAAAKLKIMFRATPNESITFTIKAGTMGGSAEYTYTYVQRKLTADQVAEIKTKAAAEEALNAGAQNQAETKQAAAQEDAEAKVLAISLAQANQVYFQGQLEKLRTEAAANPAQSDRYNYLIMVTEANLQAEKDSEATTATGEWTRTHTAYDDWNVAYMASQSQQTVGVVTHAISAEAAVPRLINLLPKELRYTETQKTLTAISQAIAANDFEGVSKIVNDLSARVHAQAEKDAELYARAASAANYVVGVTEALKFGADKAMFVLSFVPGGGPVYTAYAGATGYVEGGPARGIREVLTASNPLSTSLVAAYDGYERQVKDPKTGATSQGGVTGALVEGAKSAIAALVIQKAVGAAVGAYYKGGKGNPNATSVEQQLGAAQYQSRMANGRAKVNVFKKRSEDLAAAMQKNADSRTITELRVKAEEAAKTIKCDAAAKMVINQNARGGDAATMNRYLTHERKFMAEVEEKFQQNLTKGGWAPQQVRQFSNSASPGKAGMDVDLGIVEPRRFIRQGNKTVSNPEWHEWNKSIAQRDPVSGKLERRSVFQYQTSAQGHLDDAFGSVVAGPGRSAKEAYVNFTTSAHTESYSDLAWLGKKGVPHADFDFIDPKLAQQASDVTMFKIQHNPNAPKPSKPDPNRLKLTKDPIPDYLFFQEQSRTLVKDMNTKLIGSPTGVIAGAPLSKASKPVQQHMVDLRNVMNDFAGGRIGPIEADRQLKQMTGGQGLAHVLKEFEAVMVGGTR